MPASSRQQQLSGRSKKESAAASDQAMPKRKIKMRLAFPVEQQSILCRSGIPEEAVE